VLAADPLAIYESTAGLYCFGRGVAAHTRGGRASLGGPISYAFRSLRQPPPRVVRRRGPIGTGTASANEASRTFDGVRGWNDTGQQGKDSRNGKQNRFHHLSPLFVELSSGKIARL
jgi:hypothetical protein